MFESYTFIMDGISEIFSWYLICMVIIITLVTSAFGSIFVILYWPDYPQMSGNRDSSVPTLFLSFPTPSSLFFKDFSVDYFSVIQGAFFVHSVSNFRRVHWFTNFNNIIILFHIKKTIHAQFKYI